MMTHRNKLAVLMKFWILNQLSCTRIYYMQNKLINFNFTVTKQLSISHKFFPCGGCAYILGLDCRRSNKLLFSTLPTYCTSCIYIHDASYRSTSFSITCMINVAKNHCLCDREALNQWCLSDNKKSSLQASSDFRLAFPNHAKQLSLQN